MSSQAEKLKEKYEYDEIQKFYVCKSVEPKDLKFLLDEAEEKEKYARAYYRMLEKVERLIEKIESKEVNKIVFSSTCWGACSISVGRVNSISSLLVQVCSKLALLA